jgi:hypothetical protein
MKDEIMKLINGIIIQNKHNVDIMSGYWAVLSRFDLVNLLVEKDRKTREIGLF